MKIDEQVYLKTLTTMRAGGPARYVAHIENAEDVASTLLFAEEKKLPTMLLGGGSNILIPDEGFNGVVLLMRNKGVVFENVGDELVRVIAQAGEMWDSLVSATVARQLSGLENLAFIPGTVGAAPVQNIGAYGSEAKDAIEWVEVIDRKDMRTKRLSRAECDFKYRDSLFKHEGKDLIVTAVSFLLSKSRQKKAYYHDLTKYFSDHKVVEPTLAQVQDAVIAIRKEKLPDVADIGTAGSFFKNPIVEKATGDDLVARFPEAKMYPHSDTEVKISAAWLIEYVGKWKGYRKGDAGVYPRHALVLVNYGNASSMEITALAEMIEQDILEKTKIKLEREVICF